MNIIKKLRAWRSEQRKRRAELEYQAGFGWAWVAVLIEGQTCEDVEALILPSFEDEVCYFDDGAADALPQIRFYLSSLPKGHPLFIAYLEQRTRIQA